MRAGSCERGPGARTRAHLLGPQASREEARRWYREALPRATVAVGNLDECDTAVGVREPRAAARALHGAGIQLAIIKQGPAGVLAKGGPDAIDGGVWNRNYVWQRYTSIGAGTTEVQKNIIADRAIQLPRKG